MLPSWQWQRCDKCTRYDSQAMTDRFRTASTPMRAPNKYIILPWLPLQALKKAKNFELGKLKRRVKVADGDQAAKLQEQLQAVKSADLESLTNEIVAEHQWWEVAQPPGCAMPGPAAGARRGSTAGRLDGADTVTVDQGGAHRGTMAAQIVCSRLKRAKCVRDQVRSHSHRSLLPSHDL